MTTIAPPPRRPVCRIAILLTACAASMALAADEEIPDFVGRPSTWKTGLVAQDAVIWDKEFAQWVAAGEKKAHDTVAGTWTLLVRCTFAHCYSGGFIHELNEAVTAVPPISNYSANSACKYFETASAYEDDAVAPANWYSRYALAWKDRAKAGAGADPVWTLKEITKRAYNGMITGGVGDITKNPSIALEHPQYESNVVPDDLKTGDLKLAILFAGDPERRHINNVDQIRSVLKDQYGFVDDNIWIMCGNYGPTDAIPNVAWKGKAKATRAELEKALREVDGFVVKSIKDLAAGEPLNDKKVKLFVWTTNHGTADAPVVMSVDPDSEGEPGTDVAGEANPQKFIYDAGSGGNAKFIDVGAEVYSFSTGNDEVFLNEPIDEPPSGVPGLYFSVDHETWGLEHTDVERVLGNLREPAAGVFAAAAGGDNREFIRGRSMGLLDELFDEDLNPLPTDDVTALSMVPAAMLVDGAGGLREPVFYTLKGSPEIWVMDPWHPVPAMVMVPYVFWNPAMDGWIDDDGDGVDDLPGNIDGLSMKIDMNAAGRWKPGDPGYLPIKKGNLKFKPGTDVMVLSVPRADPFRGSGCDIYRWDGLTMETIYTCASIGLADEEEVDALHTYSKTPYRLAPTPSPSCQGDFDDDGMVDGNDLGTLLGEWMRTSGSTDLNGDGVTNGADLGILLGAWGPCP